MTITSTGGSKQGINALKNGVQIGGTTIYTGDGTPSAYAVALRIGDLYVDYTNGVLYIASATGTGSWVAYAGLSSMASGATIGGASIFTRAGSPAGAVTAIRVGDLCIDYTNGVLYIAEATGTGSWIPIPRSTNGAAATTSDGGAITHGLGTTPTTVLVSGSVVGQIVTVTSIGATTFTVAIKTNLGAAGTAQTIYWEALP